MPSAIHGDHLIFRVQFITALLTIILWRGGNFNTERYLVAINDALFDRYYLSGMAPDYGYTVVIPLAER